MVCFQGGGEREREGVTFVERLEIRGRRNLENN
jgi:hypothetical protein